MPIDPLSEDLISFAAATKLVPIRRRGRPCHVSTIHRWAQAGCRSATGEVVHLEWIRAGGSMATSRQAMRRFFQRLTDGPDAAVEASERNQPRTPAARKRAVEKAVRELAAEGI